jgi:AcrR family transcriptional regulator
VPVDELPVAVNAPVDVGDAEGHVTRRAAVDADMAPLEAGRVGEVSAGGDEAHGWAATTVAAVAADAAVSPKTIQALFGTKATLLAAAVDYAIAGDVAECRSLPASRPARSNRRRMRPPCWTGTPAT